MSKLHVMIPTTNVNEDVSRLMSTFAGRNGLVIVITSDDQTSSGEKVESFTFPAAPKSASEPLPLLPIGQRDHRKRRVTKSSIAYHKNANGQQVIDIEKSLENMGLTLEKLMATPWKMGTPQRSVKHARIRYEKNHGPQSRAELGSKESSIIS